MNAAMIQKERELESRCIGLETAKQNAIDKNLGDSIVADYDYKLEQLRVEIKAFYNNLEVEYI